MLTKMKNIFLRTMHGGKDVMDINKWEWDTGVALYGISRLWKLTGDESYKNYLIQWYDEHLKAYTNKSINSTAPLLAFIELCKGKEENRDWMKICRKTADWLVNDAQKTVDGGLEHTVNDAGIVFHDQLWADTLFMACIFLAKFYEMTGERVYADEAAKQLKIHLKFLYDAKTGMYCHGWDGKERNHMSAACWGRANAWVLCSCVEILECLPEDFDGRNDILNQLEAFTDKLCMVQCEDGMYRTILNDENFYKETSATAGITYGLLRAFNDGYVNKEEIRTAVKKGINAINGTINDNGEVENVSTGTPVLEKLEYYRNVPCSVTLYGQGLAMLLLAEQYKSLT